MGDLRNGYFMRVYSYPPPPRHIFKVYSWNLTIDTLHVPPKTMINPMFYVSFFLSSCFIWNLYFSLSLYLPLVNWIVYHGNIFVIKPFFVFNVDVNRCSRYKNLTNLRNPLFVMRLDNLARVGMTEGLSRQSTDLIKWPEVHSPSTRTIESSLVRYSKKTLFISNFSLLLMLETWKFYLRAFAAAANTMNQNSKSNFAYHCVRFPLA